MAPKRKPSMLARQRQLLQQSRQNKAAARRQLPPSGGTSANSLKATAQRTSTRVQQKVNQDIATVRALADNMRRNQERSNRQIQPDPSPRVRYTGPNGPNPKGQPALPQGQRGGDLATKGGPLATQRGGPLAQRGGGVTRTRNGGPVDPVRVRDMGNTPQRQLPGQRGLPGGTGGADSVRGTGARTGQPGPNRPALPGSRPALPPSQRLTDAQAKQDAAARGSQGPSRVGQPAGSANRVYGANRVNEAVARAQNQAAMRTAMNRTLATSAVAALVSAPEEIKKAQRLMKDPNKAIREFATEYTGMNFNGNSAKAKTNGAPQRQGPPVPQRILAAGGGKSNQPSNKTPEAPQLPASRQTEVRSSGRPSSASRQSTQIVRPPSAPSASKAPKQEAKAQPTMDGIGPVKDGELYSDKLKISKVGTDGFDMERRRAFLDAKDATSGMKAVRALLEKRKKRMAEG